MAHFQEVLLRRLLLDDTPQVTAPPCITFRKKLPYKDYHMRLQISSLH